MRHLHPFLCITLCVPGVSAQAGTEPWQLCDQAASLAAREFGVPEQVMQAITRVETGQEQGGELRPWPWAVNVAGASHWFDTATEAQEFVKRALETGRESMDIGCFQLNLRWHAQGFSSLEEMFDPQSNANYAARFLTELFQQQGNWVDAVAAYHSRTPEHAAAYVSKVEDVLIDLATNTEVPAPLPEPRTNLFPLLKPGETGRNGSLFASDAQGLPLIGGGS